MARGLRRLAGLLRIRTGCCVSNSCVRVSCRCLLLDTAVLCGFSLAVKLLGSLVSYDFKLMCLRMLARLVLSVRVPFRCRPVVIAALNMRVDRANSVMLVWMVLFFRCCILCLLRAMAFLQLRNCRYITVRADPLVLSGFMTVMCLFGVNVRLTLCSAGGLLGR